MSDPSVAFRQNHPRIRESRVLWFARGMLTVELLCPLHKDFCIYEVNMQEPRAHCSAER